MTKNPNLFWGMIASMWLGNLMLLIINLPLIGLWVRLLKVPYRLMFPAILMFCCIGIYSINSLPTDVMFIAFFGLIGYALIKFGFEPAPLLLGFVLGKLMEENLAGRSSSRAASSRPSSSARSRPGSSLSRSSSSSSRSSRRSGRGGTRSSSSSSAPEPPARLGLATATTHGSHVQMKRMLATLAGALAVGIASLGAAGAQTYPQRPITMIVPFAAGGPTDVIARIVGDHMSRTLGQQVVVENVAGAGGTTGITRASQAAPDGYTIMMGHMGTHGAAPALYPALKYDPAKSFDPIGLAAGTPIVIVAKKDFPATDLKGFLDHLKKTGDKVNQAHAGVGSVSHTTGILFNSVVGVKPTMVAYRGTGPALNDLMSGQVDFMTDQIVNVAPQVTGGNIKAYAIATPERSPALPNVPTTKEAGLPNYEVSAWNAVFAPKGLPQDVRTKLVDALEKALTDDGTRKRLVDLGGVIAEQTGRGPDALQKLVESEVARWTPVLKEAGAVGQ
jgi:tripartite-type tricarboxylate transporter receptor subunit TctC